MKKYLNLENTLISNISKNIFIFLILLLILYISYYINICVHVYNGDYGSKRAAIICERIASICINNNLKAKYLSESSIWYSIYDEKHPKRKKLAWDALQCAKDKNIQLYASRVWLSSLRVHNKYDYLNGFQFLFTHYPITYDDAAIRARYINALLDNERYEIVEREFQKFSVYKNFMFSIHATTAVIANSKAILKLHGTQKEKAFLKQIITQWPETHASLKANEILISLR